MKTTIAVVGAIIVEQNKILCAQRPPNKSLSLLWEFPGGKIESGESPEAALTREIMEEFDCSIQVCSLYKKTTFTYSFGTVHLSAYVCQLVDEKPVLREHNQIKWLPIEELHSLNWAPADIPIVEQLIKEKSEELGTNERFSLNGASHRESKNDKSEKF